MTVAPLNPVTATDGPFKLSVTGMPALRCVKGHSLPVDQEFMVWLIHELKDRGAALPAGQAKGMIFSKYLCSCGAELPAKSEQSQVFPLELAYESTPPFKAAVEVPVYKCAACGKAQMRSPKTVTAHAAQATVKLNDAVGFPHSG
jgi:hypothetical protein